MKIKKDYPPNYNQIAQKFDIRGNPRVIFTYGDTLYVPNGAEIPPDLMAHEETHTVQQLKMGVAAWWDKYLVDDQFRLNQEVEAYRAQYKYAQENMNRHGRRALLNRIASDLSGVMYGNLCSFEQAVGLITGATA